MTIAQNPLLARMRSESAETFLTDLVRVWRPGAKVLVGGLEQTGTDLVYQGRARLVSKAGDRDGVQRSIVEFDYGAFVMQDGDEVEWTTSADPNLVRVRVVLTSEVEASVPNLYRVYGERQI